MTLSDYAISKPITTIMAAISIMVLGAISVTRLPLAWAPDLTFPAMRIYVQYPSSSPEEIDRKITRPIEEAMGTLSFIESISSQSSTSRSSTRIQFGYDVDMDLMAVHVRDRLDQVRANLPDDVERIEVRRWNSEDWPILTYTLGWAGDDPEELVSAFNHVIEPRIQRVPGVGNVEVWGMRKKVLLVEADKDLLNTHKMDIRAINRAIRANNLNVSAGQVYNADKRLAVRTLGEFRSVSDIRELPLRDGFVLGDVANVSYDYPELKSFQRLDGRDAISMNIRKTSTANLVETTRLVEAEMATIIQELGSDRLQVKTIRDRSADVLQGIFTLAQSAFIGGVLAVCVIFGFLRSLKSTIIIGSAIPVTSLCVFVFMYVLRSGFDSNITLNLISMMGLMVAVGMMVDPSVVTLENIYRKRFDLGMDTWTAAREGAREVGLPVVTAALTTICVFIPIIFVTDSTYALFMKEFAITVCISIVASLGLALTLVPLAGSRVYRSLKSGADRWIKLLFTLAAAAAGTLAITHFGPLAVYRWIKGNATWFVDGFTTVPTGGWMLLACFILFAAVLARISRRTGIKQFYGQFVSTTLRYRWTTVSVACLIVGSGAWLYSSAGKQSFRWQPARQVAFNVEVPRSYTLEDGLALFARVEKVLIARKADLDVDAVSTRFSVTGSKRIILYMVPVGQGRMGVDEVKRKVKALLPKDIPGVRFKSGRSWGSTTTGVSVELRGRDPDVLSILAEDVRIRMEGISGVHEVESSLESGTDEIRVIVDRNRARRYGLSPRDIATTISTALGSRGNAKFKTDDREIDIQLLLKEEDRANLAQLRNTVFESVQGTLVSFASLANFRLTKGPRAIEREDRMKTVSIFANTDRPSIMSVGSEMRKRMQQVPMPSGYSWQMDRGFRRMSREQGEEDFTMLFAAALIYMIMAALFESYVHPFTIMFCISFAIVGVAIGLYTFDVSLDNNTSYGFLILFGIVVNNGIVLVDHINRYRKQGLPRKEAIIRGGQDRLRPIMMTAITTIFGLVPLVIPMIYRTAEGTARIWGPMGLVVVSGLASSTLLTLLLLPTVYSLMDDLSRYFKRVAAVAGVQRM